MRMRLRMLKHCVGKGRHIMKQLHVCLIVSVAIRRYSGYRACGVCALQSSSYSYNATLDLDPQVTLVGRLTRVREWSQDPRRAPPVPIVPCLRSLTVVVGIKQGEILGRTEQHKHAHTVYTVYDIMQEVLICTMFPVRYIHVNFDHVWVEHYPVTLR